MGARDEEFGLVKVPRLIVLSPDDYKTMPRETNSPPKYVSKTSFVSVGLLFALFLGGGAYLGVDYYNRYEIARKKEIKEIEESFQTKIAGLEKRIATTDEMVGTPLDYVFKIDVNGDGLLDKVTPYTNKSSKIEIQKSDGSYMEGYSATLPFMRDIIMDYFFETDKEVRIEQTLGSLRKNPEMLCDLEKAAKSYGLWVEDDKEMNFRFKAAKKERIAYLGKVPKCD